MFAVRGIAVSLSVFVIVFCVASFAVLVTWKNLWSRWQRQPAHRRADWLFFLRTLPLISAILVTAAFAVPSFLLFEPRSIEEPVGSVPVILSFVALTFMGYGVSKSLAALRRSWQKISQWTRAAEKLETEAPVSVLRVSSAALAMTAAGIVRPRILLSDAARALLSPNELRTALNHELAHVRRQDNFRKLLLQLAVFPPMSGLDAAWLDATEMAADDAAVANTSEALDLASALIKLSRFAPLTLPIELTAALVHSPATVVDTRVKRLIAWQLTSRPKRRASSIWYGLAAAFVTIATFALPYNELLVRVHTATEWLVR